MKSRLFHLSVGLSLLLFAATLALWARGYWARDGIWYSTATTRYSMQTYRGRVWCWELSGGRAALDGVWNTPTNLHSGWVWDSTPDSYYDQFRNDRKWGSVTPEQYTIAAPATGYSPADPQATNWHALGFQYLRTNGWTPIAQLQQGYPTARSTAIFIPHWAMAVVFGLLPAAAMLRAL